MNDHPTIGSRATARRPYDITSVRSDFPIFAAAPRTRPFAYLDSAASAQKPGAVIEAERAFLARDYANIHRGVYGLSERATARYESARAQTAAFLNAARPEEIVFTRNTTEAINLVASSYGDGFLEPGDEILLSELEHHSNIVPWQLLRQRRGVVLKVVPVEDDGSLALERLIGLLGPRTKLVALAHVSNVLGTVLPVAEITRLAHQSGAKVLLDGAQAVTHLPVDVQALDCDFYAFSGHKLYGPTGIGVLYGRYGLLDAMGPYQGGGDMIRHVAFEGTSFAPPPARFEAGTPAIAQAIGLAAAIGYVQGLGLGAIAAHEADLLAYATRQLAAIEGLRIIGQAPGKVGVISFVMDGVHPHDIAQVLDEAGVMVRAGHHCAQPLMARFGVAAMVRASFGLYNSHADVDALVAGLHRVREIFGP